MTTAERFQNILKNSLASFRNNWDVLASFQASEVDPQAFIGIQASLLVTLFELQTLYNSISSEIREIRKKKQVIKCPYFDLRLELLQSWNQKLNLAIDVGKVIGDSFAWIFYEGQHEFLLKHRSQPGISAVPTRVGGLGEIEFLKNCPKFGEYLTLSHSITTFLSVGDVSLIDPQSLKIEGIGEIKSYFLESNELCSSISLVMSTSDANRLPKASFSERTDKDSREASVASHAKERLERQVRKIEDLLRIEIKNTSNAYMRYDLAETYGKIESICRNALMAPKKYAVGTIHQGLLLAAVDLGERDWFSGNDISFLTGSNFFEEILNEAKVMIKNSLAFNSIFIGWVLYPTDGRYRLTLGMRPFFWWPIDTEIRRRIVFKDLAVLTIYNPAYLLNEIQNLGFKVDLESDGQILVSKISHGCTASFTGINFLFESAQSHLFTDDHVIQIFRAISKFMDAGNFGPGTRISLDLRFIYN